MKYNAAMFQEFAFAVRRSRMLPLVITPLSTGETHIEDIQPRTFAHQRFRLNFILCSLRSSVERVRAAEPYTLYTT